LPPNSQKKRGHNEHEGRVRKEMGNTKQPRPRKKAKQPRNFKEKSLKNRWSQAREKDHRAKMD